MEPLRVREELQRKQQRWMAERQMALDRQDALGGVAATTAAATATTASATATTAAPAVKAKVDDYQLLDRVTTKITERLQNEMRLQNARAMQDGAVGDHVERLLERHLEAHTCGICFELMSGKERRPTLLFPCGHTFCASCLSRLLSQSDRRNCPHCRQHIASHAPNVSLQQVIDTYVERQQSLERGVVLPEIQQGADAAARGGAARVGGRTGGGGGGGGAGGGSPSYAEQFEGLSMRTRVLEQQLRETRAQQQALAERRATTEIVLRHLTGEEAAAAARLEAARLDHEAVRGQVAEQRAKLAHVDDEHAELRQQADLVSSTLSPLEAEREKLRLLAQAQSQAGAR